MKKSCEGCKYNKGSECIDCHDFNGWTPEESDTVCNPGHYTEGRKYEPLGVIEDWQLDYHTGNALKYISRAGRKGSESEDLKKAVFYLQRKIERLSEGG